MQKQLLTNGNAFKRTDGRWGGVVWYKDEKGERKRKSFSGTTKAEVNKKMTDYITKFEEALANSRRTNIKRKNSKSPQKQRADNKNRIAFSII